MRVLVHDPIRSGASDADQLLRESDYVVPLAVATAETENLIGKDAFAKMKDGAYLINVSRGNLVDEAALEAALDSGRLAGCAMDVGPCARPDADAAACRARRRHRHAAYRGPHAAGDRAPVDGNRRAGCRRSCRDARPRARSTRSTGRARACSRNEAASRRRGDPLRGIRQGTGDRVRARPRRQPSFLVAAGRAFRADAHLRGVRASRLSAFQPGAGQDRAGFLCRRPLSIDRGTEAERGDAWSPSPWAAGPASITRCASRSRCARWSWLSTSGALDFNHS